MVGAAWRAAGAGCGTRPCARTKRSSRKSTVGPDGETRSRSAAAASAGRRDRELFEQLRAWRAETARAAGVPAYVVFPDSTLTAIAQSRPASLEELMAVNGVGVKKLEQYGDAVLTVVASAPAG